MESDYAKIYPSTQLRWVIKTLDQAYLEHVGYITGTLSLFITQEQIDKIKSYVKNAFKDLPKDYRPNVLINFTVKDNCFKIFLSVFHRHLGKVIANHINIINPTLNKDVFICLIALISYR